MSLETVFINTPNQQQQQKIPQNNNKQNSTLQTYIRWSFAWNSLQFLFQFFCLLFEIGDSKKKGQYLIKYDVQHVNSEFWVEHCLYLDLKNIPNTWLGISATFWLSAGLDVTCSKIWIMAINTKQ